MCLTAWLTLATRVSARRYHRGEHHLLLRLGRRRAKPLTGCGCHAWAQRLPHWLPHCLPRSEETDAES